MKEIQDIFNLIYYALHENFKWITKNGTSINLEDMEGKHLFNAYYISIKNGYSTRLNTRMLDGEIRCRAGLLEKKTTSLEELVEAIDNSELFQALYPVLYREIHYYKVQVESKNKQSDVSSSFFYL